MNKLIEKAQTVCYYLVAGIVTILMLLVMTLNADAAHLHHEKYYQQLWCDRAAGVTEYRLPDATRVDCLLDVYAIEFDFASKWAESIGQALYYGLMTDSKPGVVLIMEKETDVRYLKRLNVVADELGIKVWTVGPEEK